MSLLTNLVSYWKLDEASGDALDAHGSNTLTDVNFVGSATGKVGNARDFESTVSQYFTHADNSDLSTGDIDFTFSLWFNLESSSGVDLAILSKNDGGDEDYSIEIDGATQTIQFRVCGTAGFGGQTQVFSTPTVSLATWYHVVCWHDSVNNQVGVCINAGTPDTASHSAGVYDGTTAFRIGNATYANTFDGLIDEVGFWKRVLTSQERSDLYNGGAGLAYPLTVASSGGPFPFFLNRTLSGGMAAMGMHR